jgi:hypothetical protein
MLALAACSSAPATTDTTSSTASSSGSFTQRVTQLFSSSPSQGAAAGAAADELECPVVDVRQGASTLTTYGPGENTSTNVRYQASIGQTARECAFVGANMTIKVGVQGRIIIGPLGAPSKLDIPVRLALVHEGPEPKTLWTRLYKVPVAIAGGQSNVPFVHVEEGIVIPKPRAADLESYVIYVGFDQQAQRPEPAPRRARTSSRSSAPR